MAQMGGNVSVKECKINSSDQYARCMNDANSDLKIRSVVSVGAGVFFSLATTPLGGGALATILATDAGTKYNAATIVCTRDNTVRDINCG